MTTEQQKMEFESAKLSALEALDDGRAKDAFHLFKPFLQFGYEYQSEAQFAEAFKTFEKISRMIAGDDLADMIRHVVNDPRDVEKLYNLGHALIEHNLPGIAAMVLEIANQLHPNIPGLISELVTALEQDGKTREAVKALNETPELIEESFLLGYLHSFNSLLSGDLSTSRASAGKLRAESNDPHQQHMVRTLAAMHQRADQIDEATWLDETDLRGWHYVINGGLLTHLSPHGWPEPMNGRYAFLNDTRENCLGGIQLLKQVLTKKEAVVERIFALPDRNSEILAAVAAGYFNVPLEKFETGESRAGLIVCYAPAELEQGNIEYLREHRAGQVLYTHALQWTQLSPITGDVTSLLYQTLISPWQSGVAMDQDDNIVETPADDRPSAEIAEDILQLSVSEEFSTIRNPEQLDRLINAIEIPKDNGSRSVMWENSPVPSARFT